MADQDEILVALRRITRAIDLQSKRLLRETGLTAPQLVILQLLRRQGPMAPSAVARAVSLSHSTVTTIMDRLRTAGLVERKAAPTDKRIQLAALTEKGTETVDNGPAPLQSEFLARFNGLKDWEKHTLIASLQRVAELMDAENLEASPILEFGEIEEPKH